MIRRIGVRRTSDFATGPRYEFQGCLQRDAGHRADVAGAVAAVLQPVGVVVGVGFLDELDLSFKAAGTSATGYPSEPPTRTPSNYAFTVVPAAA